MRAGLLAALLAAGCSGPEPAARGEAVAVFKELLPQREYVIQAETGSESRMETAASSDWKDPVTQENLQGFRSLQVLRTGEEEEGVIPLELETLEYVIQSGDAREPVEIAGAVGLAEYDRRSRQITLTGLEGEWADSSLDRRGMESFLQSSYQAIQSVVGDTLRNWRPGEADTTRLESRQAIGPVAIDLVESTITELATVTADSLVFRVRRKALLVDGEQAHAGNTTLVGDGEGTIVYDRNEHYITSSTLRSSLRVEYESEALRFRAGSLSTIDVSTRIARAAESSR